MPIRTTEMEGVGLVLPVVITYAIRVLTRVSVLSDGSVNKIAIAEGNYYLRKPVLDLNR